MLNNTGLLKDGMPYYIGAIQSQLNIPQFTILELSCSCVHLSVWEFDGGCESKSSVCVHVCICHWCFCVHLILLWAGVSVCI